MDGVAVFHGQMYSPVIDPQHGHDGTVRDAGGITKAPCHGPDQGAMGDRFPIGLFFAEFVVAMGGVKVPGDGGEIDDIGQGMATFQPSPRPMTI